MPQLQLTGNGTSPKYEKIDQALDLVMDVLRDLVKAKLQEKGLARKTKPIDWIATYEKLLPESERREKVEFT